MHDPKNLRLPWLPLLALGGGLAVGCAAANPAVPATSAEEVAGWAAQTHSVDRSAKSAAAPRATPGPMTFDALVAAALAGNLDLQLSAARIDQAHAGLLAARRAWWPSIQVEASYVRADAPSMYLFKTIDAGRFKQGTDFNRPGVFDNWEAGVGAQFNLYNGGQEALNRAVAGDALKMLQLQSRSVENALLAALADGWYGVRAAQEQVLTARASIRTLEAQISAARARHAAGSGLRTDVLSLEVRMSRSQELLLRAENGRDLGLVVLAQLVGFESPDGLSLIGEGVRHALPYVDLAEALELALLRRPEISGARRRVAQAESNLKLSETSYLPRADAFARGWRDAPAIDFDESRDNWAVGLSLSWNAFNGSREPAVERTRAQLKEARRAELKAHLSVQLEVRTAWLQVSEAEARLAVSTRAASTAGQTLDLVRAQYEGGAALITRYLEAELAQTESKMRQTNARYDLERARAGLARAVGQHFDAPNESVTEAP